MAKRSKPLTASGHGNSSAAGVRASTIRLVRFRTETGSVYEVVRDAEGMRWRRLSATLASGPLRSEQGDLTAWPDLALGERCELWSEPINPPWPRIVLTTQIVAFLEIEADGPAGGQGMNYGHERVIAARLSSWTTPDVRRVHAKTATPPCTAHFGSEAAVRLSSGQTAGDVKPRARLLGNGSDAPTDTHACHGEFEQA
jgi:hypothetical protein